MSGTRRIAGTEELQWNGRRYRRHPHHKDRHRRAYFMATVAPRTYLHRDIYEAAKGPIPAGWAVHHIDHNVDNNDPSNLVAISVSEHMRLHGRELATFDITCDECGVQFAAKRQRARWCSPACKERRRRREGTAYVAPKVGPWREERICDECGAPYVAKRPWARFCSSRCKQTAARRLRVTA